MGVCSSIGVCCVCQCPWSHGLKALPQCGGDTSSSLGPYPMAVCLKFYVSCRLGRELFSCVHRAMDCNQKDFIIMWWWHQLLSRSLPYTCLSQVSLRLLATLRTFYLALEFLVLLWEPNNAVDGHLSCQHSFITSSFLYTISILLFISPSVASLHWLLKLQFPQVGAMLNDCFNMMVNDVTEMLHPQTDMWFPWKHSLPMSSKIMV